MSDEKEKPVAKPNPDKAPAPPQGLGQGGIDVCPEHAKEEEKK